MSRNGHIVTLLHWACSSSIYSIVISTFEIFLLGHISYLLVSILSQPTVVIPTWPADCGYTLTWPADCGYTLTWPADCGYTLTWPADCGYTLTWPADCGYTLTCHVAVLSVEAVC